MNSQRNVKILDSTRLVKEAQPARVKVIVPVNEDGERDSDDHNDEHAMVYQEEYFEQIPIWVAILTYLGYAVLLLFGHLRDLLRYWHLEEQPHTAEPLKEVPPPTLTV